MAVSHNVHAQPSGYDVIDAALNRENAIPYGRLMFKLEVTPNGRKHLSADRPWDMPPGDFYLRFHWSSGNRWRVDILGDEKTENRSIVCDGTTIDTGDAIWDAEFFYRSPPSELGALFRKIEWPLNIVQEHVFPFSMLGRWDKESWEYFFKISTQYASDERDESAIVMSMEDEIPRPGVMEIPRIGDDGSVSTSTIRPDPEVIAQSIIDHRIILETSNNFLPTRWESYSPEVFDGPGWSFNWTVPTKIPAGVKNATISLVCEKREGDESDTLLWRSTIRLEESDIANAPSPDLFTIERFDFSGTGKDLVQYRGDESNESWLEWFQDFLR